MGSYGFLPWRHIAVILLAAGVWLQAGRVGAAHYDDVGTPEGWAWSQIRQGYEADFNKHCDSPALAAGAVNDPRWADGCRQISGTFISDVLSTPELRDSVPFAGVLITGARINGEINLRNAEIARSLMIKKSLIENDVTLVGARAKSVIGIVESKVRGSFVAEQLRCEFALELNSTEFDRQVLLKFAKIDGYLAMHGVTIGGLFSAESMHVGMQLFMGNARFGGVAALGGASITGNVVMNEAVFAGDIIADSLAVGGSLFMRSVWVQSPAERSRGIVLNRAKVNGNVYIEDATFEVDLEGDALQVGASLFIRSKPIGGAAGFHGAVRLVSAKITGNLWMAGNFKNEVMASALQVEGSVLLGSKDEPGTTFERFLLVGAKVGGNIEVHRAELGRIQLTGANITRNLLVKDSTVDGEVNADAMQIGESLLFEQPTNIRRIVITSAKVKGKVEMIGARVHGDFHADFVQIGGNLDLSDVIDAGNVTLTFAQISGNFDIHGATFRKLDLSGATIGGEFDLRAPKVVNEDPRQCISTSAPSTLILRNTRITTLVDAPDAWPAPGQLFLSGFRFSNLGGLSESKDARATEADRLSRGMDGMKWWDCWARLDTTNTPTPYEQLASALAAAGDRTSANDIRYLGRVREHENERSWLSWMFSWFLKSAAGFGIGDRTFRVLYWVVIISVAGGVYLWAAVPAARKHGALWCFGASVSRLLPVIELNKEFTEFFNDPKRSRLTETQTFVFSTFAIIGFVLGAILVAAVSGLTQK